MSNLTPFQISQARSAGATIDPAVTEAETYVETMRAAVSAQPDLSEYLERARSVQDPKDVAKIVADYRKAKISAQVSAEDLVTAAQDALTRAWVSARPRAVESLFVPLVDALGVLNDDLAKMDFATAKGEGKSLDGQTAALRCTDTIKRLAQAFRVAKSLGALAKWPNTANPVPEIQFTDFDGDYPEYYRNSAWVWTLPHFWSLAQRGTRFQLRTDSEAQPIIDRIEAESHEWVVEYGTLKRRGTVPTRVRESRIREAVSRERAREEV